MLSTIIKYFYGSKNDRFIRKTRPLINAINQLEPSLAESSDEELKAKAQQLQQRAQSEPLDNLLVETFALVREASKRTIGLRHHDVQLIGAIALHRGNIAEMATGEGKTLVATLAVTLNAWAKKGVHVVTVNSYLAERDAKWMGKIYNFLGLSVGIIIPGLETSEKKAAYAADIVYASNNELGFDFLRDNMAHSPELQVQRTLNYAIVDEVDSILIDEARTPLIISGPIGESSSMYQQIYPLVSTLSSCEKPVDHDEHEQPLDTDVIINIKERQVQLSEQGHRAIEKQLIARNLLPESQNLYANENALLLHYIDACLRAHFILKRDIDYIVSNQQVVIIDEHTGRAMPGRRWSSGHHQAVEAKEQVPIQEENQTLASITFQNYFRLYSKLAGMTGTADTEATELEQIYSLQVIVIPTNKTCIRQDEHDAIYMSKQEKYAAIVADISKRHARQQPILVGTTSIEDSEYLSKLLKEQKIAHRVLNAKQHAAEAEIVAEAGEPGKVTIATNMAGRGTDIVLGGNLANQIKKLGNTPTSESIEHVEKKWKEKQDLVRSVGGLHVLGSERNESRRVDNQLRGRCSRQGDPGSSQFFLSLEDHLFRIFPQSILNFIRQSNKNTGECLQAPMLNHAIATNQQKMEAHYYDIRKQVLKYDDIANEQRLILYEQRNELLNLEQIHDQIPGILRKTCQTLLESCQVHNDTDLDKLQAHLDQLLAQHDFDMNQLQEQQADLENFLVDNLLQRYQHTMAELPSNAIYDFEKKLLLQILDNHWKEHLLLMEDLRESIGFRGYAQRNPEHEYKIESYNLFSDMLKRINLDFISHLLRVQIQAAPAADPSLNE